MISDIEERRILSEWYRAPSWRYKVSKMPDDKVRTLLERMRSAKEYRASLRKTKP